MPHFELPQLPEDEQEESLKPSTVYPLLRKNDRPVVARGTESVLEKLPHDETRVAAHSFREAESTRMRKIFYNQRILTTLFPNNFPKFHAGIEHQESRAGGTIREHVSVIESDKKFTGYQRDVNYTPQQLGYVIAEMREMGLNPYLDAGDPRNFGVDDNGNEMYLDVCDSGAQDFINNKDGVIAYMQEHKYSETDIKTVENAIERLRALTEGV